MNSKPFVKFSFAGALCALLHWITLADPLAIWHQRNSLSQTNPLFSVVYGNGLFVAVGESGTVLTSPDGIAWSRQNSGTSANLGPIIYGSGVFLVRGPNVLFRSNDGTTWTSSPWAGEEPIDWLDFANDRFFVFAHDLRVNGDHAIIFTSTDSTNWTRFNTGLSGAAGTVAYGNGLYAAVGTGFATVGLTAVPFVLTSTEATTWRGIYFDSPLYWNLSLNDVAFGNGRFVAVGDGANAYSLNGTNWNLALTSLHLDSIAFADGVFVTVGAGTVLTSTDGINWIARDPGGNFGLGGVAYGQNTFVAAGGLGIIVQSDPIVAMGLTRGLSTQLSLTGPSGRTCEINAVDQLLATNNWQTLGTVTLTNSAVSWTDPGSTNKPQRFYRAVLEQ